MEIRIGTNISDISEIIARVGFPIFSDKFEKYEILFHAKKESDDSCSISNLIFRKKSLEKNQEK